jgi:hypothetical protein
MGSPRMAFQKGATWSMDFAAIPMWSIFKIFIPTSGFGFYP